LLAAARAGGAHFCPPPFSAFFAMISPRFFLRFCTGPQYMIAVLCRFTNAFTNAFASAFACAFNSRPYDES
jgi:hypothetical protein